MSKMPERTFGVELEIVGLSEEGAFLALRHAGIPVNDPQSWGSHRKSAWDIKDDCSLHSPDGRTAEVVSPILRGVEGLKEVRKVCRALESFGGKVNKSCGLHVHVGAKDLTPAEVVKIITRYAEHEDFINKVMHPSRRGRGEFCGSMKPFVPELDPVLMVKEKKEEIKLLQRELDNCNGWYDYWARRTVACNNGSCRSCQHRKDQIRELERRIETGDNFESVEEIADLICERYMNVNVQAYYDHGTLEFRQHNGTVDATKVTNWIRFVVNFVEQSRALTPRRKNKKAAVRSKKLQERYEAVYSALKTAGARGLTPSQVARVGGWKTTGVPQATGRLAKAMQCTIEVSGGRYKLVRVPHRSKDNGPLMGLPSHVKEYFRSRSRIRRREFEAWA